MEILSTRQQGVNKEGVGAISMTLRGDYYDMVTKGDRDCSSAVCEAWELALAGSPYDGLITRYNWTGLERLASLTVFETAPFNHSGTSPNQASLIIQHFQKFRESPAKKSGPAAVFRDWEDKRYAENPIQPVNTPADPP